ncbi:M56 family metallopeptidase [Sulfuriroseicoccus oceanibius]|uniref:Peptidase M56 domain-containing protein n=1 Tax=Sulfuriroseicoccus oceanibius TaxID=2707525 RepID=A0A6B3LB59_9BACT|nr:M56 family metallopeptidase [Sulfuriroseicoccus oceanibius]QQL45506.1 hypothetical protein G3M56_002640 [Sulfuriroseicoccus oceanibius]
MFHWLVIVALKACLVLSMLLGGVLLTRRTASSVVSLVIAAVLLSLPFLDVAGGWIGAWHWQVPELASTGAFSRELPAFESLQMAGQVPAGVVDRSDYAGESERGIVFWGLTLWGMGAVTVLALRLWRMLNVRLRYARSEPLAPEHPLVARLAAVADRVGVEQVPWLLMNPAIRGPQTSGILRSYILVPAGFDRLGNEAQEMILCHELAHVRRGDVLVRLMLEVVLVLFWFHPLVWLALRRYDLETEKACDDAVLDAGYSAAAYSEALLMMVKADHSGGAAGGVRKRIESVLNRGKHRLPVSRRSAVGFVTLVLLLLAPVALLAISPYPRVPKFEPLEPEGELRALWRMSLGRGSVLPDWSGNDCHGRVIGAQWVNDPERGACLSFDGVDDHLVLRAPDADWTRRPFTLCIWLKPPVSADGGGLLLKGDNNQVWSSAVGDPKDRFERGERFAEREISLAGDSLPAGWQEMRTFQPGLNPTLNYYNAAFQRSMSPLRAGQWNHLAIVWNPNTAGGADVAMFINGQEVGVDSLFIAKLGGHHDWPTSVWYFARGESPLTSGNHYEGLASDLAVFQRALDSEQVGRVMRGEFGAE